MQKKFFQNKIFIQKSTTSGYGVYAGKKIRKGEKIEECYIIISKGGDKGLGDFYFDAKGKHAIFLGYGCVYNHSDDPNADYHINVKRRMATIIAEKTIQKGEEIFISYGNKWFSSRGLKQKNVIKK